MWSWAALARARVLGRGEGRDCWARAEVWVGPSAGRDWADGFGLSAVDESTTPSDMTIDYKVSSFQINLSSRSENKLLPNDLIIIRNYGDDEEDVGEEFGGVVDQQGQPSRVGGPIQVELESASKSKTTMH